LAQEKGCFIFSRMMPFAFPSPQPRLALPKGLFDLLLTFLQLLPSGN